MDQLNIKGDARPEDEPLPFLSNFQDIFLTLGLIIFLVGVGILSGQVADSAMGGSTSAAVIFSGIFIAILVLVLLLSEVVVRGRRRILPGIVLCLVFLGLSFALFVNIYGAAFGENAIEQIEDAQWEFEDTVDGGEIEPSHETFRSLANSVRDALPWTAKAFVLGAPFFMLGAALFYYRRYRLPFASAMVGLSVVTVVACVIFFLFPYDTIRFSPLVGFVSGLLLLFAGVSYDMRDPERVTRWSGNGFWLHFVAAPLLLSSALGITSQGIGYDFPAMAEGNFEMFENQFSVQQSVVTLIVIGIFAIISLLLNRRALVVAGLVSAGVAIGVIVNATGMNTAGVAAVTMIALGGGILLLGLGWNGARKILLALVPSSGPWGRIFPRENVDG